MKFALEKACQIQNSPLDKQKIIGHTIKNSGNRKPIFQKEEAIISENES